MGEFRQGNSTPSRLSAADAGALAGLGLLWLTVILAIDPRGEFPIVDDWSYREPVQALVEQGRFFLSDWTAANLLTQIVWGSLFALPWGASYLVLRVSTLVAAALAAVFLYLTLRQLDRSRFVSMLAALALVFNPIFLPLAFSFMSDVPYVAIQAVAIYFLVAAFRDGSRAAMAIGIACMFAAHLERQIGYALGIGFAAAYLVAFGWGRRQLLVAVTPLVAMVMVQTGYEALLRHHDLLPQLFGRQMNDIGERLLDAPWSMLLSVLEFALYAVLYIGLFALPVSLSVCVVRWPLPRAPSQWRAGLPWLAMGATTVLVAGAFLVTGRAMPVWNNTWTAAGVGPDGFGDAMSSSLSALFLWSTAAGVVLLMALLASALRDHLHPLRARLRGKPAAMPVSSRATFVFLAVTLLALAGATAVVKPDMRFDRYLLPLLPLAILLAAMNKTVDDKMRGLSPAIAGRALATLLLIGMGFYSVVIVHNYLAEKRVIAAALERLVHDGVPRARIDATWPFNGAAQLMRLGQLDKLFTWYEQREYVIGAQELAGHRTLRRYPVERWLGRSGPLSEVVVARIDWERAAPIRVLLDHNKLVPPHVGLIPEGLLAQAPSMLVLPAPNGGTLSLGFGVRGGRDSKADATGSVCFSLQHGREEIWQRCLDPLRDPADRGEQRATITLPDRGGKVRLKTTCLQTCTGDWSYWSAAVLTAAASGDAKNKKR